MLQAGMVSMNRPKIRLTNIQLENLIDIRVIEENIIPIPESGCWIWTGTISEIGYALIKRQKHLYMVHRLMWEYANKQDIPENMKACHKCDIRCCINPDHIFIGTQIENIKDMYRKNRGAVGEKRPLSKLKNYQIPMIRKKLSEGISGRKIAKEFGVAHPTIDSIRNGLTWKHIQ